MDNIQFKTPTATYLCAHKVMTWADKQPGLDAPSDKTVMMLTYNLLM